MDFKSNKISIIFCVFCLVMISLFPVVKANLTTDDLDQFQLIDESGGSSEYGWNAQSFKPTVEILTRVELKLELLDLENHPDLQVSIRESLNGEDLISFFIDSSEVARGKDWYECDFQDISVVPENTYYIVTERIKHTSQNWLIPHQMTLYETSGGSGDVYPRGSYFSGGEYGIEWISFDNDLCFKTYGEDEDENYPPIANTGGPYITTTNVSLELSAKNSYDPDGSIIYYHWDLDDDEIFDDAYGMNPIINTNDYWQDSGSYPIHVQVIDDMQQIDVDSGTLIINLPPHPDFSMFPSEPLVNEVICFNASKSTDDFNHISNYSWDFGDGTCAYGERINHSYSTPGLFFVTLEITDNYDFSNTLEKQIKISSAAQANLTINNISGGFQISIEVTNTGNAQASNISWNVTIDPSFPRLLFTQTDFNGMIKTIEINETITLFTNNIFGFGPVDITIRADTIDQTINGFVFGPIIKI